MMTETKPGMERCGCQVPIAKGLVAEKMRLFNSCASQPTTPAEWSRGTGYRGIPVATAAALAMQRR